MTERQLLPLLCGKTRKAHIVGRLVVDASGRKVIRYKSALRVAATGKDADDFSSVDGEWSAEMSVYTGDAWCPSCQRRFMVPTHTILEAAAGGADHFKLEGRNPRGKWAALLHRRGPGMD